LARLSARHEHAHPVVEQCAVGRVMDVSLDHRPIDAELAPARHLERASQADDVIQQLVQRLRPDEIGPPEERGITRHRLEVETAELAQHQTVADPPLSLCVAPAVEMLDDQQTQDDLNRRRGPSINQRPREAPSQIGLDLLEERVIIEQGVETRQDGLDGEAEGRDQGENVHRFVAIAQHI